MSWRLTKCQIATVCGLRLAGVPLVTCCNVAGAPYKQVRAFLDSEWADRTPPRPKWTGAKLASRKLTELRALTAHRAKDDGDMVLTAVAYVQRLAQYPADVVSAACDGWADREQWWPTWAELKAECDKRMRGRLHIRETLRRFR